MERTKLTGWYLLHFFWYLCMSTFSHPRSELTNPRTRFIHVNTTSGPYSFSIEAFKQHAKNRSH